MERICRSPLSGKCGAMPTPRLGGYNFRIINLISLTYKTTEIFDLMQKINW
jgi:hypothetical protein